MRIMTVGLMNNTAQSLNYSFSFLQNNANIQGGLKMKAPLLADEISFGGTDKGKSSDKSKKAKGKEQDKKKTSKTSSKKTGEKKPAQKKKEQKRPDWEIELDKMLKEGIEECEREGRDDPDELPPTYDDDYESNFEKALRLFGERNA